VTLRNFRPLLIALLAVLVALPLAVRATPPPPVESDLQGFLDAQPGALKTYRDPLAKGDDGDPLRAAEAIQASVGYYGLSPRILLALLEATGGLLSNPSPADATLKRPFGPVGPEGFAAQVDWAAREVRAGLGPYERAPSVTFTNGTTATLSLDQAPEGVAVQRFLAKGRDQAAWRAVVVRFVRAFEVYFANELPEQARPQPQATAGFLGRPWAAGTRVVHLAYFDHMFPTVDTGRDDNGYVVNYRGRGGMQYDGHDGHDFYFPDQPIGTRILAAADGVAHASTHRGNGVWIEHPGGYVTVYWHFAKFAGTFRGKVDTGEGVRVRAGDLIGTSGKTGFVVGSPHLHFEVRHNGKQVDPYGWYGSGADPCATYSACEPSVWLWNSDLAGEFDFTPPDAPAPPDTTPPAASIAVNPPADLLLLDSFDAGTLPQLGTGMPTVDGSPELVDARYGKGALLAGGDRLAFPTKDNLSTDAGTIGLWARLPERYPATPNGRQYLLAASAHADEGPVYTDTLALRRDTLGPGGAPRWNFWTTPEAGEAERDDLAAPDTLAPGWHHFAISWDRARKTKALYIDGALQTLVVGVELPENVGETLDLGRWSPAGNAAGVAFDELAIFGRALGTEEIARLVARDAPLSASAARVTGPHLLVALKAADDGGGIMSVQLAVNGAWGDPQPYEERYAVELPGSTGSYTISARLYDRAGNAATVSTAVELVAPELPQIGITDMTELGATLAVTATDMARFEMQISPSVDFAGATWRSLAGPTALRWRLGAPMAAWLRLRDKEGTIVGAWAVGPAAHQVWLPMTSR
jgi:murein DD-endopeptidase MepM/ murein hydrolase activator NlpD